jgi:hypothetical protein
MPPPQNDKNEQDFQFTMYDLRGPWADQKVKEALLPQLNAKLAAAVLLDRVQTREKAIRECIETVEYYQYRAMQDHEKYSKIAPNAYGTGVEYGSADVCKTITEELKELIIPPNQQA